MLAFILALFSIQLSAQKPKPKKKAEAQYTIKMRPDSTTFSDPKSGKKVFSVATRDMPPPPPPAAPPVPPAPPKTPVKVTIIKSDSTIVQFSGSKKGEYVSVERIKKQSESIQRQVKLELVRAMKEIRVAKLEQKRAMVEQKRAMKEIQVAKLEQKRALKEVKFFHLSNLNKPLIVIDGVITLDIDVDKINPNNIQSINVLKGENALAKYPSKGEHGVIEITTKK
jgi:hypothetical protein